MKGPSSLLLCCLWLAGTVLRAQDQPPAAAPDLAALEQTAQQRHAEWEALAKDMNARMARILPCDPRALSAVNEVSRASETRLAALADYLRAVSAKAFGETAAIRSLLDAEERRAVQTTLERADAGQEQTAVETQVDALTQSVRQRMVLEDSRKLLENVAGMIRQRVADAETHAAGANAAVALLRDLAAKFEARDAALREEFAAFEAERVRWDGYYTARRSRAQLECSITQIGPAPAKGKQ